MHRTIATSQKQLKIGAVDSECGPEPTLHSEELLGKHDQTKSIFQHLDGWEVRSKFSQWESIPVGFVDLAKSRVICEKETLTEKKSLYQTSLGDIF